MASSISGSETAMECVVCHEARQKDEILQCLQKSGALAVERHSQGTLKVSAGQYIHKRCRDQLRKKYITNTKPHLPEEHCARKTRSVESYDIKTRCIFCGQGDRSDGRDKQHELIVSRTLRSDDTLLDKCAERQDEWASRVHGILSYVSDLHSADAVYHHQCRTNFLTGKKDIPAIFKGNEVRKRGRPQKSSCTAHKKGPGRPKNDTQHRTFDLVVAELTSDMSRQWSLVEVQNLWSEKLNELGYTSEPLSIKTIKQMLLEKLAGDICISGSEGEPDILSFKRQQDTIIRDFYKQSHDVDPETEKIRIVSAAGALILDDIMYKENPYAEAYPTTSDISSNETCLEFVPASLRIFLSKMITSVRAPTLIASLGQAIMQAARPRSLLAPLQFGLALQMNHHFASRYLNDTLYSHGFASSYDTVQNFRRAAAVSPNSNVDLLTGGTFGSCVQFVGDNVDHNQITIDGHNTLHAMGIMAVCTPAVTQVSKIARRTRVTKEDILFVSKPAFKSPPAPCTGLSKRMFPSLRLPESGIIDGARLLWSMSPMFAKERPSWSGFMQTVFVGEHSGTASFHYLPIIDLDPTDMTCIYSTLCYIHDLSTKYNVPPVVTFDEPLFWKANQILESEPSTSNLCGILVKLGGFHTLMNGLGAIGHIMDGSGFQEVVETIYARNTIPHILSGKAYDRALRANLLVLAAVNIIILSASLNLSMQQFVAQDANDSVTEVTFPIQEACDESSENSELLKLASGLYNQLHSNEISPADVSTSDVITTICEKIDVYANSLQSRTSKLWLQHRDQMNVILDFLKAERLGDFNGHLISLRKMLPYLAAAGHNRYLKSVSLYLDKMDHLQETHPDLHKTYVEYGHTVRRSDRLWAGLSLDLCIEQGLMRVIKSPGGLTHGRGVDKLQRTVWLMSAHIMGAYNEAMEGFSGVNFSSSDQHRDVAKSRMSRDMKDLGKVLTFLLRHNPFQQTPYPQDVLRNIATGKSASERITADQAREMGEKVLNLMEGQVIADYTFSRKNQISNMASDKAARVKVGKEEIEVDPNLLFQRFAIAGLNAGDLEQVLHHEMCSYPPALFENPFGLRSGDKSSLINAIANKVSSEHYHAKPPENSNVVIDGGALLHRVTWPRGNTYSSIFSLYLHYMQKRYPRDSVVVFDGYRKASTKDNTHGRRYKDASTDIDVQASYKCDTDRERFLANPLNKSRFIMELAHTLEPYFRIIVADGDADYTIATTALKMAEQVPVIVVSDDTDVLILLLHHASQDHNEVYFRPEPKWTAVKEGRCWAIQKTQSVIKPLNRDLLVLHAASGCDTTSYVYGVGKSTAVKLFSTLPIMSDVATVFMDPKATLDQVKSAGSRILCQFYRSDANISLDKLRFIRFSRKAATSVSSVDPKTLPPTSAAAIHHSQRIYHQVQEWLGHHLDPADWGWTLQDNIYKPKMTSQAPAPRDLMEAIYCGCKTGCTKGTCKCRKLGLLCTVVCLECKGYCYNGEKVDIDDP